MSWEGPDPVRDEDRPQLTTPLEALVVGPDELLVLRAQTDDIDERLGDEFMEAIDRTPFKGRVLFLSNDIELTVVKK